MLVAQRSRDRSHSAAVTARPAAPRARPAAPVAPLQRVADGGARDDRLGGLLARAVERRGAGGPRRLQRAIIAINGAHDGKAARRITKNCLSNLTSTRARGAAVGPADIDPTNANTLVPPALAAKESLYILGHGNETEIGDFSPDQLGAAIIGWYGGQPFRGKVKLVACSSAVVPSGVGARSYADRLNTYLTNNATATFRPKSVDGVLGVAWVHEGGGNIVAIDDPEYTRQEKLGEDVEGAFATKDADARRKELERLFGRPNEHGSSVHTGKPGAKVRFYTNLPKHPPPTGWSLRRVLRALIPCIP